MAKYLEIEDLKADLMYNNQFDLETVGELLNTLEKAKKEYTEGLPPVHLSIDFFSQIH